MLPGIKGHSKGHHDHDLWLPKVAAQVPIATPTLDGFFKPLSLEPSLCGSERGHHEPMKRGIEMEEPARPHPHGELRRPHLQPQHPGSCIVTAAL